MSTPSTPRSTRTASASPAASPEILTPGQKIKAMLAAFDSDSDSEAEKPATRKPGAIFANLLKNDSKSTHAESDEDEEEEEDEEIIKPRGRMAARLQGLDSGNEPNDTIEKPSAESAFERVSKTLRAKKDTPEDTRSKSVDDETVSSDDDLPAAGPRRRVRKVPETRDADADADGESARSQSRARSFSPLFVSSPTKPQSDEREEERDGAADLETEDAAPKRNHKFLALKEKIEAEKKAARATEQESANDEGGPEKARPARKAGKKALEEMSRETQRISRNMQLAHEARTKKKITKESFFARFNFMQPQHSSDIEAQKDKETPQTSPALPPADALENLEQLLSEPKEFVSEDTKDQTTKPTVKLSSVQKGKLAVKVAPVRVRLTREQVARHQKDDSDSDLEVVTSPAKCRRIAAFENLPARHVQEPASVFKLKALAQLTSPGRKSTMNPAELSAKRKERIEELRAKGIVVETAAERAAFEDEVENIIAKLERAAAKRDGDGDEDDDSDFEPSDSEDEEEDEEEDEDEDEEMEDEAEAHRDGNLIDSEAGEDEDNEDSSDEEETDEPPLQETDLPTQRRKRPTRVVSDDEDEEEENQAPKTPAKPINPFLNSVERPNIPVKPSEATMSLTQAFAGTLAPSQDMSQDTSTIPQSLPEPIPMSLHRVPDSPTVIKDSQEQRAGLTDPFAGCWQPNARVSESPAPQSISQMSQLPDPTQDAGFVYPPFDPNKRFRGTPTSTIETVLVDHKQSPIASRNRGNLRRGKAPELSAVHEEEEEGGFEIDASAFDVMKTAAKKTKKPAEIFDRNKSKAKDVVEDAAEESEDEYAGLGGASDDDADDEENALDREMINDDSKEKVDAKQLAALNALHQRSADEKDVAKLLKDITTGALRRRRGADDEFDLDDSDDELLARRRQKQREFARMRNALLADEKVGEIAENPKKAAFFRAIEDRDDDDDFGLDFLGDEHRGNTQDDPSSQDVATEAQATATDSEINKRKRPLEPSAEDINNRPPPHLRRTPANALSKKPATLAEIRETLSFLTERPEYDSFQDDASVDDDEDEPEGEEYTNANDDEESDEPSAISRQREPSTTGFTHPRRTRGPVVDRLALLRQASSNSATTASSNTRFAFHAGRGSDKTTSFGFKPPILRKSATASSSSSASASGSESSRGVTKASSGAGAIAKKGSVNYYTAARERERERQLRTQHRSRGSNIAALLEKHASNRLGSLGGTGNWD
ncbi:MRC1-like domain-containing protein [Aspergillus crustosus]